MGNELGGSLLLGRPLFRFDPPSASKFDPNASTEVECMPAADDDSFRGRPGGRRTDSILFVRAARFLDPEDETT